jgi:hypothetical protein
MSELSAPMAGDGIRAEPLSEQHREALKAACAEDLDIWQIYAMNFGPEGFERSFDRARELGWVGFALFEAMSLRV